VTFDFPGPLLAENSWLKWIIGNDPTKSGTPRLQWANFPESWGVFVLIGLLIGLAYAVFWLYRREINTCPPGWKWLLAGLRLSVLLLLVGMFLKPSVFYQQVTETKPVVALLRDRSMSMDRGDSYLDPQQVNLLAQLSQSAAPRIQNGEVTRAELINRIFENNPQLVLGLQDKGSVKIIDFADGNTLTATLPASYDASSAGGATVTAAETKQVADDSTSGDGESRGVLPRLVADGLGTDIGLALKESLEDTNRLSAIVLFSDGQHNAGEDPLEYARRAATMGKPIYVVGIGDPNPPRNLAVSEIYVRDRAYPDEPFEIEGVIQSSQGGEFGVPDQIEVQLIQQRIDPRTMQAGPPETVKSKTVELPAAGGRTRVDFDHVLNQPGTYQFTLVVPVLENETETGDNRKAAPAMEVVDEKIRVLLVSGVPSWDYQHVQRLLQRDPSISLSCWLQTLDASRPQEGNQPIARLPRSMEELGQYNIVMLLDPNPEEFDKQWIDLLQDFTRHKAGGVLYMAGPHFTSEFLTMNRLSGIRELLPVRFGNNEFIDSIQALADARDTSSAKMIPVLHNLNHPVMSFRNDSAENQRIWNQMPNVYWNFPTMSAKPTARILLEKGDQGSPDGNQPLMVAGRFGAGSVLYMAFRGTYRWRSVGLQAQYYDRFWIQVIRFLVETRSLQGSRRGFVDLEKTEFELGNRINLMARVLDAQFQPSLAPEVNALIRAGDGRTQRVPLKRLPQQEGRYEGSLIAQRLGNYQVTLELDQNNEEGLIEPVPFRIVPPSAEANSFWLNEKLLQEIATLSGGRYFRLHEIGELPDQLPGVITRAEFNGPPEPLWDLNPLFRWLTLLLPAVLLTLEWSIRKWKKLL
jgi:hypothetical protein